MIFVKKELRKIVRKTISELDADYLSFSDRGIYENVLSLDEVNSAELILLYYSVGREVDTRSLLDELFSRGKTVALPVCQPKGIMSFFSYSGRMTEDGFYGIPVPEGGGEIEPPRGTVMIVPALAFDCEGFRLGQGGGYYDRYLASHELFTVGVGREELLLDKTPTDAYDMPVSVLVTEKKIARLR
ncbi:MAG: 5-formyltetrahydrofolate cyclo-ligase [Oscillospiraceae bacterium]|nr:5-formyltetrahydrofolate cyclo-ligase [Oscillospiraceae bacterium]